jgi:hypothetical protein
MPAGIAAAVAGSSRLQMDESISLDEQRRGRRRAPIGACEEGRPPDAMQLRGGTNMDEPGNGLTKYVVVVEHEEVDPAEQSLGDYLRGDFARMFQTGVLKCCLPMAFTYLAQLAPSEGVAQEKLAQIAGGLLLYTWAFGCPDPGQDQGARAPGRRSRRGGVRVGLGRIVALHRRSSTLYQIY